MLSTSKCFEDIILSDVTSCNATTLCNSEGLCALCASIDIDISYCGNASLSNTSQYEVTASIRYGVGDFEYLFSGVIGTVQSVLDTQTTSLVVESKSTRVTLSGGGYQSESASDYKAQFQFMSSALTTLGGDTWIEASTYVVYIRGRTYRKNYYSFSLSLSMFYLSRYVFSLSIYIYIYLCIPTLYYYTHIQLRRYGNTLLRFGFYTFLRSNWRLRK